jgi:hypothetical protein
MICSRIAAMSNLGFARAASGMVLNLVACSRMFATCSGVVCSRMSAGSSGVAMVVRLMRGD